MNDWSLPALFGSLHRDVEQKLETARESFAHPGTKGCASENAWLELFQNYLPTRYQSASAHIVDSKGEFSDQIDVVIFDRQYTPFMFRYGGQNILPAESVYAVFEVKQTIHLDMIRYTQKKIRSVRSLYRTSLPIPHAGTEPYPAKKPARILGGILTLESEWSPSMGEPFLNALKEASGDDRIDLGCIAAHGFFHSDTKSNEYTFQKSNKATTSFLFELIGLLQNLATVSRIDVRAYARWLSKIDADGTTSAA